MMYLENDIEVRILNERNVWKLWVYELKRFKNCNFLEWMMEMF